MKPYPRYKDSGVPWLGQVPEHWAVERIRFRARMNPASSKQLKAADIVSFLPMESIGEDGQLNLEQTRTVSEVASGYTCFEDGDLTIAKITPCFENGKGAVMDNLINGAGFGTTELIVVRPDASVVPRWLYYLTMSYSFRSPGEAMMLGAGGQKRVPDIFVRDYPVAWPDLAEQQAITAYLDRETARIDALLAEKKSLIDLLREARDDVFSTLLLDAAADLSGAESSRYPWLGKVPNRWVCLKIKHLIESLDQGISPQCESRQPDEDEWGVLKVGCVNSGVFDPSEAKALPSDISPIESITLKEGDVLVSRANTKNLVGRAAMAEQDYPRLMLSDKLYRFRVDTLRCDPAFLVGLLALSAVRSRIEERATGASASMLNIDQRTILDLDVVLPSIAEQKGILLKAHKEVSKLAMLEAHALEEIILLKELRAATIADAVLGRIDLRG